MDAELAARVLQLIKITDSGLHAQVISELVRDVLSCNCNFYYFIFFV